ncbi:ParB/RepB/Spo0J family partition protein [Sphingomonas suaedae]|uniref:ParB/RepB/Spo0J family partition protein n=1 Tax=Sphingomonas suaedae TaxID=2599297 RepID=A0A518RCJ9_9SPHN|nr:ParB/RepB/Spo0J family partition protein [Sphingomonas suaedae]QDX25196.1 ParB/RepB/Spo0J family partition protein [Sphingomonas suaedae]
MKLDHIPLDRLSVSKTNMRYGKKPPDVSDILPTVRKRGVIVPVLVRPNCAADAFEIVAGARRFRAAQIVAEETGHAEPMPCAILEADDDAAAIEASLIENIARLDPNEVSRWETFVRLVKQGQTPEDIGATFGLPDLMVRRILALGNLLPRIRDLYRADKLDPATVRHLTMASKAQQKAWLALYDDPDGYAPSGHQLKAWLFGGAAIKAATALFPMEGSGVAIVADLFGEDAYVADPDAFWIAQNAAIEARRDAYLEAGWADVVIVPASEQFHSWEYEKTGKRRGGRVYVDVRANGEVTFHEGYVSRAEARRAAKADAPDAIKPARPEVTGAMQAYLDLHRHAAVRAALVGHPGVALRLMVAHAIVGSHLFRVTPEPQNARSEAVAESLETCRGESVFDEKRRAVLALLGFDPEAATVTRGNGDAYDLAGLFYRLIELPDPCVMDVVAVVMGETLASGSAAVDATGLQLGVAMADWWEADPVFLELVRNREVLLAILAEVAGEPVATANAGEKGKTLKAIIADSLAGTGGRTKAARWVPRWLAFPPAAYTARGGVGTVGSAALAAAAASAASADLPEDPDPTAPAGARAPEDEPRLAA